MASRRARGTPPGCDRGWAPLAQTRARDRALGSTVTGSGTGRTASSESTQQARVAGRATPVACDTRPRGPSHSVLHFRHWFDRVLRVPPGDPLRAVPTCHSEHGCLQFDVHERFCYSVYVQLAPGSSTLACSELPRQFPHGTRVIPHLEHRREMSNCYASPDNSRFLIKKSGTIGLQATPGTSGSTFLPNWTRRRNTTSIQTASCCTTCPGCRSQHGGTTRCCRSGRSQSI